MGQTLSEPVTEKHTSLVVRPKKFAVAVSDMQGYRITMEDSHSLHLSLPPLPPSEPATKLDELATSSDGTVPAQPDGCTLTNYKNQTEKEAAENPAYFGVFDGHGGSAVAKFVGTTIHKRLAALEPYANGEYEKALKTLYLKTDEDLRADPHFFNDPSGCTAVSGIVAPDGRIIIANSGDSRSVLSYAGEAKAMSEDHKPTNEGENKRITDAGGFVEFGRVNGNLALSRAIGDFEFKQNFALDAEHQIVTADPEITVHKSDGEEEFLVLACDGIWDCLSSQQVIDFVRRAVANDDGLDKICEDLMSKCLAPNSELGGIGCDNMTVAIVALLNGRTLEEWSAWVKDRVEKKVGYDTPESVADVFGNAAVTTPGADNESGPTGIGGLAGLGGLGAGLPPGFASLQKMLAQSGIKFRQDEDSDDDETSSDEAEEAQVEHKDNGGDMEVDSQDDSNLATTSTPTVNSIGQPAVPTHEALAPTTINSSDDEKLPEQLKSEPGGDEASGAVKVEGLMDKSEDPLK